MAQHDRIIPFCVKQVKTRQSQSYKIWKIAISSNFEILQETLHATHLLKLLDKRYKYKMDPIRTVGATEWTRNAGQMDGKTDGVKPIYPPTTSLCVCVCVWGGGGGGGGGGGINGYAIVHYICEEQILKWLPYARYDNTVTSLYQISDFNNYSKFILLVNERAI